MHIRVLGSAAGGGYPQWNCNHPNSRRARLSDPLAPARTQSSIAVSADGCQWILFNASPDLRQQINDNDILQPKHALRGSPIQAVILTNADVDHVAGLLNLRESQAFRLYGTRRVLSVLEANPIFNVLNPNFVRRDSVILEQEIDIIGPDGVALGISVVPFSVPGKVALWLEDETEKEIQKNLEKLSKNKTTLIIAHRLSTVVNADNIIVLDKGKIAEEGTHQYLIDIKGKYFEMWQQQKKKGFAEA